ncbi:MAG: prepilin-type N-terminal cleavage/methylation domain-containing protein [Planctomycetota bacterium]
MTRSARPISIATGARKRQAGLTLIEAVFSLAVLSMLIAGAGTAMTGLQGAFNEGQSRSQMIHRGQRAMERMVALVSQAVTVDPEFAGFDSSGVNQFRGLRFRMLDSVVTGEPVYDDTAVAFVYGPTASTPRCDGVIIGRGNSINAVSTAGSGADNVLGTQDDDTRASIAGGLPAVELLVPSTFSPSVGSMLTFEVDTVRRGVTITLRLNVRDGDGQFIFANDSVIQERVSLRR